MKNIVIVNSYANTEAKLELLRNYVTQLRKLGHDILLTAHLPLPEDVIRLAEYYIYDKENFLLPKEQSAVTWFADDEEYINIYSQRHSYAIMKNVYIGLHFAKSMGYDNFIYSEYDATLTDGGLPLLQKMLDTVSQTDKKLFFFKQNYTGFNSYGTVYQTFVFSGNINFFIDNIPLVKSFEEWCSVYPYANSSEQLETMFVQMLTPIIEHVHEELTEVEEFFGDTKLNVHNILEYNFPIIYNMENPNLPLFFVICTGGFYELIVNGRTIVAADFPAGFWLKTKFEIGDSDTTVILKQNGEVVVSKTVNINSIQPLKDIAIRGPLK